MAGRGRRKGDGAGRPAPSAQPFPEQVRLGIDAAVRLLAVRERSAMELRSRLRRRGYTEEAIATIIERLQANRLQSDERFAERYAADAAARGMAGRRIQGELRRRGVDKELAAAGSAATPEDERARARAVAAKRARQMGSLPREVAVRRLMGFLARRGFDAEVCRSVAAEAAGGGEGESLDPHSAADVP